MVSSFINYLTAGCVFVFCIAVTALSAAPAPGSVEGHVKIISPKEVELMDLTPSETAANSYSDYPLIILSKDAKMKATLITPDHSGNFRVALPAGEYILDVQGRRPKGHVRATPRPFTVVANQTVHVDLSIDTGVR
jgi:hypothetical protein